MRHNAMIPKKTTGFTIVELIIITVVIGILTSIVIVGYNNMQARAQDTAIATDLKNLRQAVQVYIANTGRPPATAADLSIPEWKATREAYKTDSSVTRNLMYCYNSSSSADSKYWAIIALSKSGNIYYATDSSTPTRYVSAPVLNFTESTPEACPTLASITGHTYADVFHGWYGPDTTTGPWRAWTQ